MSNILEPPPRPPAKARESAGSRNWGREDERRALWVGLLLTLIVWPAVVGGFAWALQHLHGALKGELQNVKHPPPATELDIQLDKDDTPQVKNPFKFVEVNPNAPDNEPTKTDNMGARNQQAAQEKPDATTTSDRARTEGKDIPSQQVVVGQPNPPQPPEPQTPPEQAAVKETSENAPKQQQTPLPGDEKKEGDNPDGFGTNLTKNIDNHQPIPDEVLGQKDAPKDGSTAQALPQKAQPKPRPRLSVQASPGILAQTTRGTSNAGVTGIDSRWSEFGEYMQQLVDIVRAEWYKRLEAANAMPSSGSHVAVTFMLTKNGEIKEITKVEETSGKQGTYMCTSAITGPQPYRAWTPQMIAILGEEQSITFTFYYY